MDQRRDAVSLRFLEVVPKSAVNRSPNRYNVSMTLSSLPVVACSAGVFFERAICSRKRDVETSRREEEIGRVKGSGEGVGREYFFSPPPPPFPFFALAPTVKVTTSTLPNLPLS